MKLSTWSWFWKYCARPQRVCWAVAAYEGKVSICPLGWHMNTSGKPPMTAISVAPSRFTHDLIAKSGECVLAWPGEYLAEATHTAGTRSGRNIDKFKECGLTPLPGRQVQAPLVKECVANLECKVRGQLTTGDHTIFALEIVEVWLAENPNRLLCLVGTDGGYEQLLEKSGYRFGVIKR